MLRLAGIAVSPGVAWGPGALLRQRYSAVRYAISPGRVDTETARLEDARAASARQLRAIHSKVSASAGADLAHLFEAQLLMLDDRWLVPRARRIVADERVNAEWALDRAFDEFCAVFAEVGDAYLGERRGDVADVVGRLRRNLVSAATEGTSSVLVDLAEPAILVADDLAPSFAAQLDRRVIVGLALETGSRTHHSAILARSLGLPAVAGAAGVTSRIRPGTIVLVDGYRGEVVLDPSPDVLEDAKERGERYRATFAVIRADEHGPALTSDGTAIRFEANIERPEEIADAREAGAEGIGLFRSEFLLGARAIDEYDEESQYRVYRAIAEGMAPYPVTIRTFDVDESQASGAADAGQGERPVERDGTLSRGPLGLRAIRLSLSRRAVFDIQLRALARAGRHGTLRVLLPLVSTVGELREARAAIESAARDVGADGRGVPALPVGVMIEVPSAALTADLLAADADFFSIGTNDLIQYCLAVDRADGRVARLFDPLHPAILRVIRQVIRMARRRRRRVALCGEMAADPRGLLLLLGLGVTEFSMNPSAIPEARQLVRSVTMADVRRAACRAIGLATSDDIAAMLAEAFPAIAARPGSASGRARAEGER